MRHRATGSLRRGGAFAPQMRGRQVGEQQHRTEQGEDENHPGHDHGDIGGHGLYGHEASPFKVRNDGRSNFVHPGEERLDLTQSPRG